MSIKRIFFAASLLTWFLGLGVGLMAAGLTLPSRNQPPAAASLKAETTPLPVVKLAPTATPMAGNAGAGKLSVVPSTTATRVPPVPLPVKFKLTSIGIDAPVQVVAGETFTSTTNWGLPGYRWAVPNAYAVGLEYQSDDKNWVFNGHSVSPGQTKDKVGEWGDVFRKLGEVKQGDILVITFADGAVKQYKASVKGVVLPEHIRDVPTSVPPGSVLAYTCVGPWACSSYKDGKCQGPYLTHRGYAWFVPIDKRP